MGFGFVCFDKTEDARRALEFFHDSHLKVHPDDQDSIKGAKSQEDSVNSGIKQIIEGSETLKTFV